MILKSKVIELGSLFTKDNLLMFFIRHILIQVKGYQYQTAIDILQSYCFQVEIKEKLKCQKYCKIDLSVSCSVSVAYCKRVSLSCKIIICHKDTSE